MENYRTQINSLTNPGLDWLIDGIEPAHDHKEACDCQAMLEVIIK